MTILRVCYKQGVRFDEDYCISKLLPLTAGVMSPHGLTNVEMVRVTKTADGSKPQYQVMFSAYFESALDCGPGTDTFDKMGVIEQWVANGSAPDKIIASHLTNGTVDRTRPLCPYPQVAAYKGTGSTDDAANFVCKTL